MLASSEQRKHAEFPISWGVENLPIGIVDKKACFLCSDEASMITGTVLEVDGGRCI